MLYCVVDVPKSITDILANEPRLAVDHDDAAERRPVPHRDSGIGDINPPRRTAMTCKIRPATSEEVRALTPIYPAIVARPSSTRSGTRRWAILR